MMHHAKLASVRGLVSVKQDINQALNELEMSSSDTQVVYTNLSRMYEAFADHPQASLAVDSTLASQTNVTMLRELVRLHLREEEIQWALGRIITTACQASVRFQCQAGQKELWNELFDMRSAHPQSLRVQEASLLASEALFNCNEFHATKIRPSPLLDELLGIMQRFLLVQTPRRRALKLVILALRVLVALYFPARPSEMVLFGGQQRFESEQWAHQISNRMLECFMVFNWDTEAISVWLSMILLLVRQHPKPSIQNFFDSPATHGTPWWFAIVIENWTPNANVMYSLFAILTHIFALPHNTLGDQIQTALADKLIGDRNVLDIMCAVLDFYHRATSGSCDDQADRSSPESVVVDSSQHYSQMLVLLEAIRVIRQWSERPTLLPRFEACRRVKDVLLPLLIEQLHRHHHSHAPASAFASKRLVFVLDVLLCLRHLATSNSLRSVLTGSEQLQTSLKGLQCSNTRRSSTGGKCVNSTARSSLAATGDFQDDGDLDALVAREARNLHLLVAPAVGAQAAAPNRLRITAVSKPTTTTKRRSVRHVQKETLQIYMMPLK